MANNEFWVTDLATHSVFVCNFFKISAQIPVGAYPRNIAFTREGNLAFVANCQSQSISIVDGVARKVIKNLQLGGMKPWCVAVTFNDSELLIAAERERDHLGLCLVYSIAGYKLLGEIEVGEKPVWVAVAPDTPHIACVANWGSQSVSIIDQPAGKAIQVPVCDAPTSVGLTPKGDKCYAPCPNLGCINPCGGWNIPVLDVAKKNVSGYVDADPQPAFVAMGIDRAYFTTNSFLDGVDTTTDQLVGSTLTAGQVPSPTGVALNSLSTHCVTTDPWAALISIVDVQAWNVIKTLSLKQGVNRPFGVTFRA